MSGFCLDRQRPVARKAHHCDVCFGTIATGDTYTRERNIGDDGAYTFKAHTLCDAAYWKAHSDLGLYSDEEPDWTEDVRPIVEGVFKALAPQSGESEVGR